MRKEKNVLHPIYTCDTDATQLAVESRRRRRCELDINYSSENGDDVNRITHMSRQIC